MKQFAAGWLTCSFCSSLTLLFYPTIGVAVAVVGPALGLGIMMFVVRSRGV